jgi:outer membrane protein assembly factor BamB
MRNFKIFTVLLCLLIVVQSGQSQNISQWRGANRDGIYQEKNLLKAWPEAGPKLLWSTEILGSGFASPVISGNKLYINGGIDSTSYLFAFDLKGNLLWKSPNGAEYLGKDYGANFPGARSAPTVYNDLIYVCSGGGQIGCFDTASGKAKWTVNMISDLGGKPNYFGYSESLFVDEKLVYCFPGGESTNVAALDKLTGKVVWTSKALGDQVSYCSPLMIQLPERNVLVTLSREYLLGLDARNGNLLWSYKEDSVKQEGTYCNTPIYSAGFIYDVSGVEKGAGAYKLELAPDGKSVKQIWKNGKVKNGFGGFVKVQDQLFCTSKDNKLKSLNANTGLVMDSISNLRGSVIFADNQLYCYSDNGNVALIKPTGAKMELISKFKIEKGTKEHFAHPVISNGVMYIRHGNALMAYAIK